MEVGVRRKLFSAGTDFRRQNLTSIDVRFWRLKSIPALEENSEPERAVFTKKGFTIKGRVGIAREGGNEGR